MPKSKGPTQKDSDPIEQLIAYFESAQPIYKTNESWRQDEKNESALSAIAHIPFAQINAMEVKINLLIDAFTATGYCKSLPYTKKKILTRSVYAEDHKTRVFRSKSRDFRKPESRAVYNLSINPKAVNTALDYIRKNSTRVENKPKDPVLQGLIDNFKVLGKVKHPWHVSSIKEEGSDQTYYALQCKQRTEKEAKKVKAKILCFKEALTTNNSAVKLMQPQLETTRGRQQVVQLIENSKLLFQVVSEHSSDEGGRPFKFYALRLARPAAIIVLAYLRSLNNPTQATHKLKEKKGYFDNNTNAFSHNPSSDSSYTSKANDKNSTDSNQAARKPIPITLQKR